VKTHMKNIHARLEARNRAHAVAIGLRDALIE
jgi:DNA-binding CsgD family transcriptional regulator